ncbi:MAG TPA: hypothetical protein VFO55_12820 [Gemmatimonadaceae bacterium]|nr:hypothetical protein [Gemmatimonadaceae bacterium]
MPLLLTACSTIRHGRFQEVRVESEPVGAAVAADCGNAPVSSGRTPVTLRLPRRASSCTITVSHDGFRPQTVTLASSLNRSFWGNLGPASAGAVAGMAQSSDQTFLSLVGGSAITGAGMGIDAMTGALWSWSPGVVNVRLTARVETARPASTP